MKNKTFPIKKLALVAVFLIVIGTAGAWIVGPGSNHSVTKEENVDVVDVAQIQIQTQNQGVRLHRTTDEQAKIVSSGLPEEATLEVEVVDDLLIIRTRMPRQWVQINVFPFHLNELPMLDVYLPDQVYARIAVQTGNGRVEVSDLSITELQVETTNAQIELRDLTGNVDAQTTNGRIVASDVDGDQARMRTSNGAIDLSRLTGDIDAQTTNGRVTFHNATVAQNVRLQSSNGNIEMHLRSQPEHAVFELTTTNGRRTIFGDENSTQRFGDERYEVELRTTNGRITVE